MEIDTKIDRFVYASPHIKTLREGEKPISMCGLENKIVAWVLSLPEKIQISHCNAKKNTYPEIFIGGREYRSLGDTCRMFCQIKLHGRIADYFFWDGIVKEIDNGYSGDVNEHYFYYIATGRYNHRMVLMEKFKT